MTIAFLGAAVLISASLAVASVTYTEWQREYDAKHKSEWNKRGYIRCVDGHLEIGNVDFDYPGIVNLSLACDR